MVTGKYYSMFEKLNETVKNAVVITSTNIAIKEKEVCDWVVCSNIKPPEVI